MIFLARVSLGTKERNMPTYVILNRWTQVGIEKIKDSPSRLDAARKAFRALGAE